jgi:hypothetical protein
VLASNKFTQYLFSTVLLFFTNYFVYNHFRYNITYTSGNPIGWIDPWVNTGYALAFPNSFDSGYYKESRVLTISLLSFLNSVPTLTAIYSDILICCYATIISILFLIFLRFSNKNFKGKIYLLCGALFISITFLFSSNIWGEIGGGGDYYMISAPLIILCLFLTFSINYNKYIFIGFFHFFVLVDQPTGIIFTVFLGLFMLIESILNSRITKKLSRIALNFLKFIFGNLIAVVAIVLILNLLNYEPARIIPGLQFILLNLFDSSIQNPYYQKFDIISVPIYFAFSSLNIFILISVLLKRKELSISVFALGISYNLLSTVLILLHVLGRSILSPTYFLVPYFLFGIYIYIQIIGKSLLSFDSNSKLRNFALVLSFAVTLIIISRPQLYFSPDHIKTQSCKQIIQKDAKHFFLNLSTSLKDKEIFPRVETFGIEFSEYSKQLTTSECRNYFNPSVLNYGISLAQIGFLPAAAFGSPVEKYRVPRKVLDDYAFYSLIDPLSRNTMPDCALFLGAFDFRTKSKIWFTGTIGETELMIYKKCRD